MKWPRDRLIQIATRRHIACDAAGEISNVSSIVANRALRCDARSRVARAFMHGGNAPPDRQNKTRRAEPGGS